MEPLGLHGEDDGMAAEVVELPVEGVLHLFIGGEGPGGLLVQAHLLAGHEAPALV